MAIADRAKQKISTRAGDFIASAPVPQEQILTGAQVTSGLSRKWTGQMGLIVCQVPGREAPLTLRFHQFWRPEVESMLSALAAGPAASRPAGGS